MGLVSNAFEKSQARENLAAQLVRYTKENAQELASYFDGSDSFSLQYGHNVDSSEIFGESIDADELEKIIGKLDHDSDGAYINTMKGQFIVKHQFSDVVFFHDLVSGSGTSSQDYDDDEDDNDEKESEEEQIRKMNQHIEDIEMTNIKMVAIATAPYPEASGFLAGIEQCKEGIADSKHWSAEKKNNDAIREAFERRLNGIIEYAEQNYPNAPEYLKYKADEEIRKQREAEEAVKKEAAKKAKAQARKEAEKVKKLIQARKKEEKELIEKAIGKTKLYVWLGWLGLNILFFILADEWYHYVFIVLAILISAIIMFGKLEDWIEQPVKSKLLKDGKIKSETQWVEEEIKAEEGLEE